MKDQRKASHNGSVGEREILGVRIDDVSESEALKRISEAKKDFLVFTPGPEFLVTASKDSEFKNILNSSSLNVPDGIGLKIAGVKNRVPGVDLMKEICLLAIKSGWSVGFLGGVNDVARKTAEKFPSLKVKFAYSGDEADKIMKHYLIDNNIAISSDVVNVLFVGLGHPKQEKLLFNMVKAKNGIKFKIGMGVGGSFDLISGSKKRAPRIISKIGFEWLWRTFGDPRHLVRVWRAIVEFGVLLVVGKTRGLTHNN